jgi:hypothetical protein
MRLLIRHAGRAADPAGSAGPVNAATERFTGTPRARRRQVVILLLVAALAACSPAAHRAAAPPAARPGLDPQTAADALQ